MPCVTCVVLACCHDHPKVGFPHMFDYSRPYCQEVEEVDRYPFSVLSAENG
jgi:hypothetical protein